MKKASKKLFKQSPSKSSSSINGHSSFSSAAASALSLSPVEEEEDFHRAFYGPDDGVLDRRVGDSLHRGGNSSSSNMNRHPHEIDRDLTRDELKRRGYNNDTAAVRTKRREDRRDCNQKELPTGGGSGTGARNQRASKRHEKKQQHKNKNDETRSPPFLPPYHSDTYTDEGIDGDDDRVEYRSARGARAEQKKTIDNYVASVIARANGPEYVTPLPRMDGGSGFFGDDGAAVGDDNPTASSSNGNERNDGSNLLPIPGFGEVDLLQRAIERRAQLHERIVKMERASADFARTEKKSKSKRGRDDGTKTKKSSVLENDHRMNEISERIKAEALEFLKMDELDGNGTEEDEEEEGSNATVSGSECEGMDPPEDCVGYPHDNLKRQQQQLQPGEYGTDQGPTTAQLARYGNMIRLGIPDSAVLRSMERDEIPHSCRSGILESLKHKHGLEIEEGGDGGRNTAPSDESTDREVEEKQITSPPAVRNFTPPQSTKDSLPPLKDDPNYNKYFKMLKAKVPLSWVKRVLEVDGKDSRVLDLDPDRPLTEQVAGAGVDEYGNIDWDKVIIFRTGSDKSAESSGDELMRSSSRGHRQRRSGDGSTNIQLETNAAVKAELAIMTAKAAGRSPSRTHSRQSSLSKGSDSSIDAREIKPNSADISSAAVAASNARLSRLKAMTTPERTMRRKQSVDEIRRRPPPPPPRTPKSFQQVPPSPSTNSLTSNEMAKSSRRQTYEHLPLKDDPRFSKYFQMIRSRVPRSWVERVIEVDDRDPAILDLDPNKPLAAQVDDDDSKSIMRTVATETDGSLDESVRSGALDSSGVSQAYQVKNDTALSPREQVEKEVPPPITQIVNTIDDERSVASSITNFRDAGVSQAEQSNAVLDRISAFLDKIEARTRTEEVTQPAGESSDDRQTQPSRRSSNPEDIESKLTSLIERFDSGGAQQRAVEGVQDAADEQKQFLEENQSDITKLTSLLASKLGQHVDTSATTAGNDQSDLAKLSNLLTEVLTKMDSSPSDQENKEPAENAPSPGKLGKNAALEALFAKRAALSKEAEPPKLREDPEYQKYFKMQKVGMPRPIIEQALERDGKDVSILDLDPDRPLAEQQKEKEQPKRNKNAALETLFANRAAAIQQPQKNDVPLKNDPEYQKYFKMLKVGMPRDAVVQALERDGKSVSILDLDPEKPYAHQTSSSSTEESRDELEEKKSDVPLKDDPEYAKFFKMLKMGIPLGAVEQALQKEGKDRSIASMDPNKPLAYQIKEKEEEVKKAEPVALKDDPEYSKFFNMLKMGVPLPAVKQALVKEGKDPSIIDMDPEKPFTKAVPLKEDPEYAKFFKMLKMGIPPPAVKQALQKEGKDPSIIDMNPEKPLNQQQSKSEEMKKPAKVISGPKVARKRLHWNKIDESKLNEKSFWNQAKDEHASLQLVGLDIDNEEFASLFTSQVNKSAAPKKDPAAEAKKSSGKQKVQLIDGRRRMNGSILLTKFKVDYKLLAKQVDNMEYVKAEGNELRGMMQLLPTKDESLALRSYLPPVDAPQSEIDEAIDKLGECEQYMAIMLDVPNAKEKFQCMLFRAEFEHQVDSIRDGTKLLIDACDSVQNSERFKKLLMYALKLGNALNTDGSGAEATAITLDSLLKLAEAKAFDRQTSVLHYLVSIVSKNDDDVLKISEDFVPVKAAERVAVDMLSQQLKELTDGIELIKDMAKKYAPMNSTTEGEAEEEIPEDELLSSTPMGKFSLSAESKITSLTKEFAEAKVNFADLLEFFGEDPNLTPEAFFCTINTFVSMFDQTYKELKRKEEAKERKKRIDEKRKLREEATKQGKAKS